MKQFLVVFVFSSSMLYAAHQTISSKGMTIGLYDDTSFGFSLSFEEWVFLKPNRPPTTLVMMHIDGKMIPIGSAVGFFHQRPLLTNNSILVAWEARNLLWKITIKPMDKPSLGEGFLVFISVTNIDNKTQTFRLQTLFDVVVPFEAPVLLGNNIQKITQESIWQGRSLITQWAIYSEKTNLFGMTVVAVEPSWQSVAFAEWKQFYDYPGEMVVRKRNLFNLLPTMGATFFYPTVKLGVGATYRVSYWIGKTLPPEGVVKKESPPVLEKLPEQEKIPELAQPQPVVQIPPTNTNVIEKQQPKEWNFTLIGFASKAYLLTPEQRNSLEQWFAEIDDTKDVIFVVIGHTDPIGSQQSNLFLGKKRAQAVSIWLQEQGVSSDRIVILSRGEDQPVSEDFAANRRVEIRAKRKE